MDADVYLSRYGVNLKRPGDGEEELVLLQSGVGKKSMILACLFYCVEFFDV